jgi:intracellular septation protein A
MRYFLQAAKLLLLDLASTVFFVVLYLLTHNIPLSIAIGIALGAAQIIWEFARHKPIDTMQWMSLLLVIGSGAATLLTADPRFILLKPSIIYAVVGVAMLKPGWLNRYLPPVAIALIPDVAVFFGFVWAGLMFLTALLNLVVALNFSVEAWTAFMGLFAIVSKVVLFLIGFFVMRTIAFRRRAELQPAQ